MYVRIEKTQRKREVKQEIQKYETNNKRDKRSHTYCVPVLRLRSSQPTLKPTRPARPGVQHGERQGEDEFCFNNHTLLDYDIRFSPMSENSKPADNASGFRAAQTGG